MRLAVKPQFTWWSNHNLLGGQTFKGINDKFEFKKVPIACAGGLIGAPQPVRS
jgi:hypothetical protein